MTQKESRLSRRIIDALKAEYGHDIFLFKVHGGPMMMAGLPDIIGCYRGMFFAFETKLPDHGNKPSERQSYVHRVMTRAGARVAVPQSTADALDSMRAWFA